MNKLDKEYWDARYQKNETAWDMGSVSPPLQEYFDSIHDKSIELLIPGAGNAYEAEYLNSKGFANVHVLDLSPTAVENFKHRVPSFPPQHVHCEDFFEHRGKYDLIVEQTFFCALPKNLRVSYTQKMHELLNSGGSLVGLLFDDVLNDNAPPFGGNQAEYQSYFEKYFNNVTFEKAHNSVAPRQGRELFFKLKKS